MKGEDSARIDRRLSRLEGQVRGVRRMVQEGAYCVDILTQLSAVKAAVNQVAASVVSQHVQHCVLLHHEGGGHEHAKGMTEAELLDELDEVFARLMR